MLYCIFLTVKTESVLWPLSDGCPNNFHGQVGVQIQENLSEIFHKSIHQVKMVPSATAAIFESELFFFFFKSDWECFFAWKFVFLFLRPLIYCIYTIIYLEQIFDFCAFMCLGCSLQVCLPLVYRKPTRRRSTVTCWMLQNPSCHTCWSVAGLSPVWQAMRQVSLLTKMHSNCCLRLGMHRCRSKTFACLGHKNSGKQFRR